jgi:tetratricopeptide (TPR) repeat protein
MIDTASLDERIAKCERIIKSNAESQVFAALADALRQKGDLDQAFRICRQGLRVHPNYGAGHLVMARISLDRKMYDWAEQELDEAVRLDGESRASEQLRAEILIAKGQFESARKLIGKLKGIGGSPLYIQDLEDRIARAARKAKRAEQSALAYAPTSGTSGGGYDLQPEAPRSFTMDEALEELKSQDGVKFVLSAHPHGIVVKGVGDEDMPADEVAALAAELCRVAESEEAVGYFGLPLQVAAYTDDSTVIVFRLSRYLIAVIGSEYANIGSLRLKYEEIAANFQES